MFETTNQPFFGGNQRPFCAAILGILRVNPGGTSKSSRSIPSCQWPFQDPIDWRYLPYIRPIFEAYVRELIQVIVRPLLSIETTMVTTGDSPDLGFLPRAAHVLKSSCIPQVTLVIVVMFTSLAIINQQQSH